MLNRFLLKINSLKIGIVEICEANHYTAVEALAYTYATAKENKITVFTLQKFKENFQFKHPQIEVITPKTEDLSPFLNLINNFGLDRIHINTIDKYYQKFAQVNWNAVLILTVHNTNIWFNNSLSKRWDLLLEKLRKTNLSKLKNTFYLPIKYFVKDFKKQQHINQLVNQIILRNGVFLVYSDAQKQYLLSLNARLNILVFPFCIHQNLEDLSKNNKKLRICVPGSVDESRRDYHLLIEVLKNNQSFFNERVSVDFLGYISKDNQEILKHILALEANGLTVFYNQGFINHTQFDERLQACDIILGNLKVNINSQSKYGETKETGVIFNMIKAAKPGVFPSSYQPLKELENACLFYNDNLFETLQILVLNPSIINNLKNNIKEAVKEFEPLNLYQKLIKP